MVEFIVFIGVLIVGALIKNVGNRKADKSKPSPRAQRLIERMQARQSGAQPTQLQGQYTQPAGQGNMSPAPQRQGSGRAQSSAQLAGMLHQLLQAGKQAAGPGQYPAPGQYQPAQFQSGQYAPPPPVVWQQSHRPPQNNLPSPKGAFEQRIRELMASGNEVAAVRLLSEEQDMGIIEAQKYARSLAAPPGRPKGDQNTQESPESAPRSEPAEEETRYVGSAAFAESVFDTDPDENVWASGWVDKPEADDRTDMDELWQTVRNAGRPPQQNN
ncbi:hypothetical protein EV644_104412 [Kribbella orskensis]|uniref:Uncharacterized protein n=1 Tax=Kribbella orskensis TaxID=2512216 RepID=A0ABY2BNM8_9ACTN|nr:MULTISPECIES: hypothetical protein [Kribbella]TCN42030.1 hypothetical protein EV642_103412 [Kribbella sp. VKM Ac-2500]TCO25908.1 hypothetical protein EV644_104412 [Kribbella orskensis]